MISFKRYITEVASTQPSNNQQPQAQTQVRSSGGSLQGAQQGGDNGNWGGALPKLISILPPGNWFAGSQKRSKVNTKSGGVSDHYIGKSNAYACDFGLNSTFKGNKAAATKFCIDVANNAGNPISSWSPYIGSHLTFNTNDGYRIQLIWLSNVGGNHYDHVHLGVRAGAGAAQQFPNQGGTQGGVEGSELPPGTQPEAEYMDYTSPTQALQAVVGGVSDILNFGQQQGNL